MKLNKIPFLKQQLTFIFTIYPYIDNWYQKRRCRKKITENWFSFQFRYWYHNNIWNGKSCFSLSAFVYYMFMWITFCINGTNTLLLNSIIVIMVKRGYWLSSNQLVVRHQMSLIIIFWRKVLTKNWLSLFSIHLILYCGNTLEMVVDEYRSVHGKK